MINESFVDDEIDDQELYVSGYNMFRWDRTIESGKDCVGWVLVYTSNSRNFSEFLNGKFCTPNTESIRLKLNLTNARQTVICCHYHPPSSCVESSCNDLINQFQSLDITHRYDLILIGDMNVDMSKASTNRSKLNNRLRELNLQQLIDKPTRVTETTSTAIDYVWCNDPYLYSHGGVLDTGLSDHSLIFVCWKCSKLCREQHININTLKKEL